jgi:hypothetical protein
MNEIRGFSSEVVENIFKAPNFGISPLKANLVIQIFVSHSFTGQQDRSVTVVTDCGLATGFRFPTQAENFSSALCGHPALGSPQPPVQWVPGVLSPGVKRGRGVMLLVPRLKRVGAVPPLLTNAFYGV